MAKIYLTQTHLALNLGVIAAVRNNQDWFDPVLRTRFKIRPDPKRFAYPDPDL